MNKQQRLALAAVMGALILYLGTNWWNNQQAEAQAQALATAAASATASPAPEASKSPEAPKGVNPREFMVAKADMDPALVTKVTTDLVDFKVFPDNVPVPDQQLIIKSFDQIEDKILIAPIAQGELLLKTRFADARSEQKQKMLRDVIPSGFRAIALDVDAVNGAGGFINQGDIVDVLATYTAGGRQLTRVIIQNVEVLARGSSYSSSTRPTGERVIRAEGGNVTFTVKVKPEMAIKLAHLVDERGLNRFRLILKNRDDKVQLYSQGVLLREVITDRPRTQARAGQLEAPPEIEILRGQASTRDSTEERADGPPVPGRGNENPGAGPAGQTGNDLAARISSPGGEPAGEAAPAAPPPPAN